MSRLKCLRPTLAPAPINGWKADSVRGTRQERGYGREWERLRERIIQRDERLCQECLRNSRTTVGTEVDHIVPKSRGGTDDPYNLELKCGPCHRAKTARESTGGGGSVEKFDRG